MGANVSTPLDVFITNIMARKLYLNMINRIILILNYYDGVNPRSHLMVHIFHNLFILRENVLILVTSTIDMNI